MLDTRSGDTDTGESPLTADAHNALPLVSIVMPARSEAKLISRALDAVASQTYPAALLEVIVADGMSTDGTREMIQSYSDRVGRLLIVDNPKFTAGAGLNAAIREARGEIIIRVDGHCIICSDYVINCVRHLAQNEADCVGGSVNTVGETPVARAIAVAMATKFGVGNSAFRTERDVTKLVDTVPFPAYPKRVLNACGPFDEELVRNQDDEYNARLRERGGTVLLAADVKSEYYGRCSILSLWRQYFDYGYYKVRVMQMHPRQASLRHFVPPAFVLTLSTLALSSILVEAARDLFLLLGGLYLAANLSASMIASSRTAWALLPLLPICYATLHFAYGFGVLGGLGKLGFGGKQKLTDVGGVNV